jgi:hypothetical protein
MLPNIAAEINTDCIVIEKLQTKKYRRYNLDTPVSSMISITLRYTMPKPTHDDAVYEAPSILELGHVDELTFGPSPNNTNDHHTIQYDQGPVPASEDWTQE